MDQTGLRAWEAKCIQEEPPRCQAGCPLEIDCRGFLSAMAAGELKKARSTLEKRMPLPGITARLCEAPCEQYCMRNEFGEAVGVGRLERYCIENEPSTARILRLPPRPQKVLVIGGGPSSLTAAFDLARKGYTVTLCHLGTQAGARLHDLEQSALPPVVLEQELRRLASLKVVFHSVPSLDSTLIAESDHHAVYIGQDDDITNDYLARLQNPDSTTFALENTGHFSGGFSGPGHRHRFITDVCQGRQAALSIDRFLQGASLTADRPVLRKGQTKLHTNTADVVPLPRINPKGAAGYSREEALSEADRCLQCQCLECVNNCIYLQKFGGYPKMYARQIYNNSAIVKGVHQANLLIDSCSLCGQCEELCPHDFSMADLCLQARHVMVNDDRMPPSAHWFALEEMRSAAGEGAVALHGTGEQESRQLFFPGCQLNGIRPEQTELLYDTLLAREPQTGIWLDCCGAPAHWAGREAEFRQVTSRLAGQWEQMGSPKVLTACSTCLKIFREHLPQINALSVWSFLLQHPVDQVHQRPAVAISDPCTARHDEVVQRDVRALLKKAGVGIEPLTMSGKTTECCGFGGLMENANPELAVEVAANRVAQTNADILTYCAMCREQLAKTGKPVLHLLDILYPLTAHPADERPIQLSERRINRRNLKAAITGRYPHVEQPVRRSWESIPLKLSDTAARHMEERRILADDIRQTLAYAKKKGAVFNHEKSALSIASLTLGAVTFWVQYLEENETFHIQRCWSHRMSIAGRTAP